MSAYRLLFAIDLRHTYFTDGWCDALRVKPTVSCERLLRRYNLLVRATPHGAEVYYDADAQRTGARGSLIGFAERDAFTFVLDGASAGFANYTAIDAQPAASLYYFDNLGGGAASFDGVDCPLLHPAGEPFAAGALPWKPQRFTYVAEAPLSSVTLSPGAGGAPVWGPQPVTPPAPRVALSLAELPEGRYQLQAPGQPDYAFYLSGAALTGAFAIAAIYPGGAVSSPENNAPCIGTQGAVTPRRYTIALSARALTWRYFVVPHTSHIVDDWRIDAVMKRGASGSTTGAASASAPLAFLRAPLPVVLGARTAVMFSSPQPLIVSQRPAAALTIQLAGRGFAQPFALPFPDFTHPFAAFPVAAAAPGDASEAPSKDGEMTDVYVYL